MFLLCSQAVPGSRHRVALFLALSLGYHAGAAMADSAQINFTGEIQQAGCTVESPTDVTVTMGSWFSTEFKGPGTTTSKIAIPLTLDCSAGARVTALITGDAALSQPGTINVVSRGSGTAATGVGVQLVDGNSTPLNINTSFVVANSATGGTFLPNWYARYIQTDDTVEAGMADAIAVLTLSYQ